MGEVGPYTNNQIVRYNPYQGIGVSAIARTAWKNRKELYQAAKAVQSTMRNYYRKRKPNRNYGARKKTKPYKKNVPQNKGYRNRKMENRRGPLNKWPYKQTYIKRRGSRRSRIQRRRRKSFENKVLNITTPVNWWWKYFQFNTDIDNTARYGVLYHLMLDNTRFNDIFADAQKRITPTTVGTGVYNVQPRTADNKIKIYSVRSELRLSQPTNKPTGWSAIDPTVVDVYAVMCKKDVPYCASGPTGWENMADLIEDNTDQAYITGEGTLQDSTDRTYDIWNRHTLLKYFTILGAKRYVLSDAGEYVIINQEQHINKIFDSESFLNKTYLKGVSMGWIWFSSNTHLDACTADSQYTLKGTIKEVYKWKAVPLKIKTAMEDT